ncbi:MAG: anti-sigma factor [Anaerolineae bacterium]
MRDHATIAALIPAYALHTLDEREAARVAKHLETCVMCRAKLASYEETAAALAAAIPQQAPPPYLKARLMARLEAEGHPAAEEAAPQRLRLSWWEQVQAALQARVPLWMPVGVALIAALLVGSVILWQRAAHPSQQEVMTIMLSGTEDAPEALGVMVLTPGQPEGVLVVSSLAPLPGNQQYQLWLIEADGSRDSGAVFSPDAAGRARVAVTGRKPLPEYTSFGITIEPAGGSPGPTGPKVLGGDL